MMDEKWFDGTSASVIQRIASLRRWAEEVSPEQRVQMLTEADELEPVAEAIKASEDAERIEVEAALDYSDLVGGGLLDVDARIAQMLPGQDWLSREARNVALEAAQIDWEAFSQTALPWIKAKLRESPAMINSEVMTRMAAVDHAAAKTTAVLDPVKRQRLIQEFVEYTEKLRRDAAVLESEDLILLW